MMSTSDVPWRLVREVVTGVRGVGGRFNDGIGTDVAIAATAAASDEDDSRDKRGEEGGAHGVVLRIE